MTYQCEIIQHVNCKEGYIVGRRKKELPIQPSGEISYIGLLYQSPYADSWDAPDSADVVYDAINNVFILIFTTDHRPDWTFGGAKFAYHEDFRWVEHPGEQWEF